MPSLQPTVRIKLFLKVCRTRKLIDLNEFRCCSNTASQQQYNFNSSKVFTDFNTLLQQRRDEAKRSVLVQIKSKTSCSELLNYCNNFGDIKSLHYYSLVNLNFVLIEFQNVEIVAQLLKACSHVEKEEIVPVRSPLLWFRTNKVTSAENNQNIVKPITECVTERATALSEDDLKSLLNNETTLSDQILCLYNFTKLNDISVRLRFLAAYQIESALKGMFDTAKVYPFGSSVNTFGKIGCDLDLALQFDDSTPNLENRLIFHAKPSSGLIRSYSQRHMEILGDILQYFIPGCSNILRILNARVPILRYKQNLLGLDCDLSLTNKTAVYMSELLYLYGSLDSRVCPLVFAVRYWAKEINLTNPSPGRWITNFSLTLLVLFYLQNVNIIPPLKVLVSYGRPEDERICEDGTNCSFLRDISILPRRCSNEDDLATLLLDFFQFYAAFDFATYAISLNAGKIIPKPEYSPLYIVNPLERHLNVSKNVSLEECSHINLQCQNAAWIIETSLEKSFSTNTNRGLLHLIKSRSVQKKHSKQYSNRLMSVKELFIADENNESEDTIKNYKTNPCKNS